MKVHISMSHSLVALLLVMTCLSCNMSRVWATAQWLEVRQHQKRLNKPVVKSIKSPDGDIIDCVHISHQPAFDHPLLKNHTIQMRPSFYPIGLYDENKVASKMERSSARQLWHQNGRCPEDTIPIRRTNKDDVLKATSAERYGKKRHGTIPNPTSAHPNRDGGGYEADNYESIGCYNLRCSGFVQVNKDIALGATIHPISIYDGAQYDITILIWKDPKSGNWWLQYGNRYPLGYWPPALFPYLHDSASEIQWGGEVLNLNVNGQHTTTEMGSGHYPEKGFRRASFFRNFLIVDRSNKLQTPKHDEKEVTRIESYDLLKDYDGGFFYGGPGVDPN
ncbi:hypothetical protein COCNU_14G012460 [Cocos nucifera]|uniref:Neprosin PEP catalytic domain-containing protein n=1 Tax=Cocos nucifera TaxID=13894 RepID=A0A8K0IWV1_COCNU|nr:hypothetical protein COCNU_14G012460 [Cocos nucifera]